MLKFGRPNVLKRAMMRLSFKRRRFLRRLTNPNPDMVFLIIVSTSCFLVALAVFGAYVWPFEYMSRSDRLGFIEVGVGTAGFVGTIAGLWFAAREFARSREMAQPEINLHTYLFTDPSLTASAIASLTTPKASPCVTYWWVGNRSRVPFRNFVLSVEFRSRAGELIKVTTREHSNGTWSNNFSFSFPSFTQTIEFRPFAELPIFDSQGEALGGPDIELVPWIPDLFGPDPADYGLEFDQSMKGSIEIMARLRAEGAVPTNRGWKLDMSTGTVEELETLSTGLAHWL